MTTAQAAPASARDTREALIAQVRGSAKYAQVNVDLVRRIGASELHKRSSLKDAVKATKNKLHQVAGMFAEEKAPYQDWLDGLVRAQTAGPSGLSHYEAILRHHASTRERLPILRAFYQTIFAGLHPIQSVLDVACGLNPLTIPWMGLAPGAHYHAVDVYDDLMAFLQSAFEVMGVRGISESRDVIADCPREAVDVALVLKAIPCLEQLDKHASDLLLDTIQARHIIVSFPTRTVGGRNIGMAAHYESHFSDRVKSRSRSFQRFEFDSELVFVIGPAQSNRARSA